jgi:alpha-L-arabinofuranosidase
VISGEVAVQLLQHLGTISAQLGSQTSRRHPKSSARSPHADVVKIANLAQLVNVIAPLMTREDVLVRSIFHPFRMMSERRQGVALHALVDGPTYPTRALGDVPFVDASAIQDGTTLHVFAVNRSIDQTAPLRVEIAGAVVQALANAELLTGPGAKAANTFDAEPLVAPVPFDEVRVKDGDATLDLPPLSFVAATLQLA